MRTMEQKENTKPHRIDDKDDNRRKQTTKLESLTSVEALIPR